MSYDQWRFIRELKETYKKSAEGMAVGQRFMGIVEDIEIHADKGLIVFDAHNGGIIVSCGIPFDAMAKHEIPLQGDSVQGYLNHAVEPLDLGHRMVMAVLKFDNVSAAERIPDKSEHFDTKVVWLDSSRLAKKPKP
jgi:hypothetical protein